MKIAKGVSLGPYEMLAHIGAGGMGDVWRARDQRIGREVAVKILAGSYGVGDERVQRFEQEARAAGALNHPGLVTIFDVGTTDGAPYIVMELLEGETLREALGGDGALGALPLKKAIDYAIQIASALSVAHEKGIIHRDLKPENLFITSDGRVKILDFGLAKLAADATESQSRGTARHLTSAGIVVGTPGFMSPEQARAQPLDHRTDIFSFGSVLYEMLSGRPAFDGFSAVETMHAVLAVDPPSLSSIVPDFPPALEEIVRHCMEKNPRERFQSARDLAFQLRMLPGIQTGFSETRRLGAVRRRFPYRRAGIAAVAALAIAAAGFALYRAGGAQSQASPRVFKQLTYGDGIEIFPTLAPDGKSFAFVSSESGNRNIYVQRVDGRTAINITSDSLDDDTEPAFSPDGSQIAFRSERGGGGIFVMGVTGESVRRVTDFGHNPSWSPDGTRVAVSTAATEMNPLQHLTNGDLWTVDVRTGAKRQLLREHTAGDDALQPNWSPHGKRIAFWGVSGDARRDLWTIDPDAPNPANTLIRVTSDPELQWNPVWSPDGRYLYYGGSADGTFNLWRIAMDEDAGRPTGKPEPVSLPAAFSGNYTFSQQGDLAFTTAVRSYRLLALRFDAATATLDSPRDLFGGSEEIAYFEPSPDGRTIAFATGGTQEDLFIVNADGTRVRQVTNDAARDRGVTWAPDGKTLYFYSNREGSYRIWRIQADGSRLMRVTAGGDDIYMPNVSPDGRTLAVHPPALVHLDLPVEKRFEALNVPVHMPRWSPDGTKLVGTDLRAGNIFAPGVVVYSRQTRRVEKVLNDGVAPQWLPDSRHVAFFGRQSIGVVDLETRVVTTQVVTPPDGVELDNRHVWPRLSKDGATLYVRQTHQQGDIWIVHLNEAATKR